MNTSQLNNEACSLIRSGSDDKAVKTLCKALLKTCCSSTEQSSMFQSWNADQHIQSTSSPSLYYHYHEHDLDEGMTSFFNPLDLNAKCVDALTMKTTLAFNLGIAYSRIGDETEAKVYFQLSFNSQIQKHSKKSNEKLTGPSILAILHNIGHSCFRSRKYEDAILFYDQALDHLNARIASRQSNHGCAGDHQDQLDLSSTLNCIGVAKYHASSSIKMEINTDETLEILGQALSLRFTASPQTTYTREMATILNNQGRVLFRRGDLKASLLSYQECYKHRIAILGETHMDVAATLFNMGQAEEFLGNILKAIEYYQRFLYIVLLKKGQDSKDVARVLLFIGQLSYDMNDLKQAHEYFSQALVSAKLAFGPNDSMVANVINKIGNVLNDQKEFSLALEVYKAGLALERNLYPPLDDNIAVTLLNVARIYQHKEETDKALEFFNEALTIKRHLNDIESIVCNLTSVGTIYEQRGDYTNASRVFSEAVDFLRRSMNDDNEILLSNTLNNLGLVQFREGSFNLALLSFIEAIEIRRSYECTCPGDIVTVVYNAATVYNRIGDTNNALKFFKEVLRYEESIALESENAEITMLCHQIGLLLQENEDYDEALHYLGISSQMCLDDPEMLDVVRGFSVIKALGDLHLQIGNVDTAVSTYAQATRFFNSSSDDDQSCIIVDDQAGLISLLMETNPPGAAAA
mmetsp:Transcript_25033/g.38266  ORF Transcript_25033/g.38266 Transcript_25033/m.38266 type:complete len:692 (-) Transcript_25033:82-2157(-)